MIPAPSPNADARPEGANIDHLVLHYTGMKTAADALARLRDPASKVSAHYVVDEDGTVYALVAEHLRAWHAGVSFWRGARELNGRSIGIEIVNPGHQWGYRAFPAAQMLAVRDLCLDILARHPIPGHNVVAHSDIAPDRKQDPGELFPWAWLAAAGISLWPAAAGAGVGPVSEPPAGDLMADLAAIGYDTSLPAHDVITAFQRHFCPEYVNRAADAATAARAAALLDLLNSPTSG